jgi:hypothetical protein
MSRKLKRNRGYKPERVRDDLLRKAVAGVRVMYFRPATLANFFPLADHR